MTKHLTMSRAAAALACAAAMSAAGAADAEAREVVAGFDDLAPGTRLTSQVAGVRFSEVAEVFRPWSTPFSPRNGIRHRETCPDDDCPNAWRLPFRLTEPARTVSVRVGDDSRGCFEFCTEVRMVGFDASGAIVADSLASGPRPYAADPGSFSSPLTRQVSIAARDYSIARVVVFFGREAGVPGAVRSVPGRVQLDDLRFTVADPGGTPDPAPPLPPGPAITITRPAEDALVPDGAGFDVRGNASVSGAPTALCAVADSPSTIPADCGVGTTIRADGTYRLWLRDVAAGRRRITVWLRDAYGRVASATTSVTVGAGIRLDLLDVNQAVQSFRMHELHAAETRALPGVRYRHAEYRYRGVPLAAGKRTIVRLHARVDGPWTLTGAARPHARLHGFRVTRRGLEALPGSPLAARALPAMLSNERLAVRRARDDAAYEFSLPMSWADGGIKLIGEVSPPGVSGSLTECAGCRADNAYELPLTFRKTRKVYVTTLRLTHDAPPIVLPRYASTAFARFQQIAPLRLRVEPYAASVDVSDLPNERYEWVSDEVVDRVQGAKDDIGLGGITIGLHDGRFRGTSLSHWASGLLDLVDDPAAHAGVNRPLRSAGHELMHQLGFDHAGPDCGKVKNAEDWPPDDQGKIQGWGLDPASSSGGRPHRVFGVTSPGRFEPAVEDSRYDLMSYCGSESTAWISVRNWTRLVFGL